jgi:peptide/nickel transport system substrate-binding protein
LIVACELPASFAPFPAYATIGILPKSALDGVGAAALFDHHFNQNPVGTGPYRLEAMSERRATLRAHSVYHLGPPSVDEIQLQFFQDYATAVASVAGGESDGLLVDASAATADLDALGAVDGLTEYSANRAIYTALYLNNAALPFDEVAVRTAVAHAIDIEGIVAELLDDFATLAASPIAPGTWGANPNTEPYEHNDDRARELLDEAGWLLPEGGQVRTRNDTNLSVSLMTDQDPLRVALAELIAGQLSEIGFAVTVEPEEPTNLVQDFLLPRDYQAAIFGWDQGLDPDPYPAWHSSQTAGNGRNLAEYRSEEADGLMEEARRSYNVDARQSLYYTFQEVFSQDVPSIILFYPVLKYFVTENVNGVELGTLFTTGSRFRNVHAWSVDEPTEIGD